MKTSLHLWRVHCACGDFGTTHWRQFLPVCPSASVCCSYKCSLPHLPLPSLLHQRPTCSCSMPHLLALLTVCCTPLCARWRDSWQTTAAPHCPINCSLPSADRYLIAAVCPPTIYLLFLPVHCLSANIIPSGHSLHYREPFYAKHCESKSILSLTERA
ncbi:hypothetical protein O6H91_06G008800 [Diphasiastrum complanatum]|uniref:Uncharacterized protein n=1 Tax=Diphasiastrum complanatum TaxID=34168 RepID=A0ACC2DAU6_DIPCM|nr:hypothetical protein O6H91_06G008800 [Diphasiastrum complanatum]